MKTKGIIAKKPKLVLLHKNEPYHLVVLKQGDKYKAYVVPLGKYNVGEEYEGEYYDE